MLGKLTLKVLLTAICVFLSNLPSAHTDPSKTENTPQSLLFDAPYLKGFRAPASLSYTLDHVSKKADRYGANFKGTVRMRIEKASDATDTNSVYIDMKAGKRDRNLGPFTNVTGNPVIMMFLERDIWQMKRLIGGVPVYFRNRIRKAFREAAKVEVTEIEFDGKKVPAKRIVIKPFVKDKESRRLREYTAKTYEFIVAETVPGGFYELRSFVPNTDSSKGAVVEDRIRFKSVGQ